jgi:hypothetical protein
MEMRNDEDVIWSCVVDDKPEILTSVVPWLATAIELGKIRASQIHLHHVGVLDSEIAAVCRALGIEMYGVEPFARAYPHTNKIQQCFTALPDCKRVILTDVDIVFAAPPPLDEIETSVAGKLVDLPNPSIRILRKVFGAAGLPVPTACKSNCADLESTPVEFETLPGNYNGGLLAIDRDQLQDIGHAWADWARWLMLRVDLLERWSYNLDQIAFCLAVNDLRMTLGLLDDAWNFPLHIESLPSAREPFILHHHARFDDRRFLKAAAPSAADAIRRVNGAIESFQRRCLGVPAE